MSGMGAESGSGSASINAIPKTGSNLFSTTIEGYYSGPGMQSSNIDAGLRAFDITSSTEDPDRLTENAADHVLGEETVGGHEPCPVGEPGARIRLVLEGRPERHGSGEGQEPQRSARRPRARPTR